MKKYWIVECFDSAIMGAVSGAKRECVAAGPFETYDEAITKKMEEYRSFGCYYYKVVESDSRPKRKEENYRFVDADREFDDC